MKYVDRAATTVAGVAFDSIQFFNKYRPNPSFTPKWSDKPLLKSWQKTKPPLGWPRQTDSLCPLCVKEARASILSGEKDWKDLLTEKVGEIKATILERDGQIWMVKDCPIHGRFEDLMALDSRFLAWIEKNFPGRDIRAHNDAHLHNHGSSTILHGRGSVRWFSNFMLGLAILKNYNALKAPKSLALIDLLKKFDKSFALRGEARTREEYGASDPDRTLEDALKRRSDPWNLLFIAGMWFQDLFNYDFRRTEMCIIPYATQLGEISFCAYNTGIGWRKIIENMYKNATVAEWYKTHSKHEIYARGKEVRLASTEHSLLVNPEDAARVRPKEHDVPMTAAEEERARRKAAWEAQQAHQLYEELVLNKPKGELVQIGSARPVEETEKVPV
jgi:hypothetical protein